MSKYHTTKDGTKAKKGLWYYMNKRKKSGTSRPGKGTVSDEAIKKSSKKKGGAWTRKEGQSPTGGLNAKGRASAKAEGQGNLKAPVTSKNPKGKDKSRKKSFCARMRGMRKRQKAKNNTGKDRLSLSLKKWNCKNGGLCGPSSYKTGGFLEPAIPNIFE